MRNALDICGGYERAQLNSNTIIRTLLRPRIEKNETLLRHFQEHLNKETHLGREVASPVELQKVLDGENAIWLYNEIDCMAMNLPFGGDDIFTWNRAVRGMSGEEREHWLKGYNPAPGITLDNHIKTMLNMAIPDLMDAITKPRRARGEIYLP